MQTSLQFQQHGLVKTLSHYYKSGRTVPVTDEYVLSVHSAVNRLVASILKALTKMQEFPDRKEQANRILGLNIPASLMSSLFAGLDVKEPVCGLWYGRRSRMNRPTRSALWCPNMRRFCLTISSH